MKRYIKQKWAAALALLVCVGIALTGCGGKDASSTAPESSPGASSAQAQSGAGSEAETSSTASSQALASSTAAPPASSTANPPPASSNGIAAAHDVSDTKVGGHYQNNVPAYYSGNVLVCGDYALEIFGANANQTYADIVSNFAKKYPSINVSCGIVPISSAFTAPTSFSNLKESTKELISTQFDRQNKFISGTYALMSGDVTCVDIIGEMAKHKGEYMHYRTDHHWTSLGAYYAHTAFAKANGFTPRALDDYSTVRTEGYVGSMYSFCASPKPQSLKENPDFTIGRLPKTGYTMTYTRDGVEYKAQAINAKASGYMMFLCGDQPLTHIVTENKNGKKLLVFKESFGNAFVPYMIDYYEEIVVLDVREQTPATSTLIAKYGITDALFINNVFAAAGGQTKGIGQKAAS